jgi:uncharacterized protein (DUF488 family)
MSPPMELFTVGYGGRTLPQLIGLLEEHGITRLVDVRDRPYSRKRGFSAMPLAESLRKAGVVYEWDGKLGNPSGIRELWKAGQIKEGRTAYRKLLRNGRRSRIEVLLKLAAIDRVAVLCLEDRHEACHRSVIAEEAARLSPGIKIQHL